jgi:hypothetical protein
MAEPAFSFGVRTNKKVEETADNIRTTTYISVDGKE